MNKPIVRLLAVFAAVLLASGLLVYFLLNQSPAPPGTVAAERPSATSQTAPAVPSASPRESRTVIDVLTGANVAAEPHVQIGTWGEVAAHLLLRFVVAALLAALLAFRWRRGLSLTKRNPYVAQTQILLAVVAAAMMLIVGDSAARAFGIFAAASLVRFRTNIRDPKETTVLLICLGVGLACGVGRLDMAVILTLFVLFTLWILERFEEGQIFRSMELCVATRKVEETNEVLKRIFAGHKFGIELRQLDREDAEEPLGKIVYLVNLNTTVSTNALSDQILAADPENIDRVEWEQKKSSTYDYR
ncbi:MAG: hypothetical protein QOD75_3301 [Blastocatellia bacterium]|jgi:hypothetical protein|nr:hypothetical protein [Blastocatellia bacterium]